MQIKKPLHVYVHFLLQSGEVWSM